jgi:hypothetical protein
VFFGRSREVGQPAGLLWSPAEHVEGAVLPGGGPSGCGKSSVGAVRIEPNHPFGCKLCSFGG